MARFDRQIDTAKRLITKNGQSVTWRSKTSSIPDPSAPWKPIETSVTDTAVDICFLPASKQTLEFFGLTEVPIGCVLGLMGQVPFNPSLSDVVIRDGVQLRIESIDRLSPNGQNILYTMVFKL